MPTSENYDNGYAESEDALRAERDLERAAEFQRLREAIPLIKDGPIPENPVPRGVYLNVNTGSETIDQFVLEIFQTMRSKGHDYRQGHDDDVLHNFRTVGESVNEPVEKVWFTYFYKHYSALVTYIKEGGQHESEPIEDRVKDLVVYLLLFRQMIEERKRAKLGRLGEIVKKADEHSAAEKIRERLGLKSNSLASYTKEQLQREIEAREGYFDGPT